MLFNIVRKDFILVKKYLLVMLIFSIVLPVIITSKIGMDGGFLGFFITAFFIQYKLFSSVSISEYKYKGSLQLCTTPYTRKIIVEGKYLFIIITFIMCGLIYIGIASFGEMNIPFLNVSVSVPMLTIKDLGIAFLIISILFGIIIPLQYKFGYEKTKYITSIFIFVSVFGFPKIINTLIEKNIKLPSINTNIEVILFIFSIVIGIISMNISTYIFSKKDL